MRGFIYFLTNASFPNLVKIGHTTQDVQTRIKQLNSTGVPTPFDIAACFAVVDPMSVERLLHSALASRRNTVDREFFDGAPSELLAEGMSVLLDAMAAPVAAKSAARYRRTFDLEPESIDLLLFLSGDCRHYGYSESDVLRNTKEPELKTEARLAHLKELRLVVEKRSRKDWDPTLWRITSEGKKFLFDYGHITDEMLKG